MTKRETSTGEAGRYAALASEMVVLTLAGLFIGQVLGQKVGAPFDILGIVVGALGGFILGAYSVYKTVERLDQRTFVKMGKKLCPECLRGFSIVLEECPYCGYNPKEKTE